MILSTANQVPEYELGVLGHVSVDDWCRATAIALEQVAGRHAVDVVAEWSRYRGDLDDRMVNLVASLASTTRVGLLSNAHDCFRGDLREHGIDGLFEHVICSAEVCIAKPNPEIYAIAAETFGVTTVACAFTGDRAENVHAARDAGMRSHEFRERASCARFIRARLYRHLTAVKHWMSVTSLVREAASFRLFSRPLPIARQWRLTRDVRRVDSRHPRRRTRREVDAHR